MVFFDWHLEAKSSALTPRGLWLPDASYALVCAFAGALTSVGDLVFERGGALPGHVVIARRPLHAREPRLVYVILELQNAVVAVAKSLSQPLRASLRPPLPIDEHELGYSAGPDYGDFTHAVSHARILAEWRTETAFASAAAQRIQRWTQEERAVSNLGDYA